MAFLLILSLYAHFVLSNPYLAVHANQIPAATAASRSYDYVIVGGGTAGLTVADRLTEDGKYAVLVVEHGIFFDSSTQPQAECAFNFTSAPQSNIRNRTVPVLVGNCVGGSSAINGMAVMRGTVQEYDVWDELGGAGSTWNWDGMFPYFKKAIHLKEPDPAYAAEFNLTYDLDVWGQDFDTRVYASFSHTLRPLAKVAYRALRKVRGLEFPQDGNSGTHGAFFYPISLDPTTNQRSYARTGHWDGVQRPNYDMVTGMRVNKINFDGNTAVSIQFVPTNGTDAMTVTAKREIILSAGALHTPQILQLSGIGNKELLEKAGIGVKISLPGVGANFQDHSIGPTVNFNWTSPKVPPGPPLNIQRDQGLAAFINLPVTAPEDFPKIAEELEIQDIAKYLPVWTDETIVRGQRAMQRIFAREMRKKRVSFLDYLAGGPPSGSPINLHITSRGVVQINTSSPESEPIVDYRALSNPVDISLMIAYVKFMRWHFRENYAEYNTTEINPGVDIQTDEQLAQYVRDGYSPQGWHPIGTAAKMPRSLGGVVDEELFVHGAANLRVVDASVMPTLIGGTTQQTVYAIAEKAAAMIMAKQRA